MEVLSHSPKGILDQQWQEHLAHSPECPYVFHRYGKWIRYPYVAWRNACRDAGLSGKFCHDFRRTAVRNLVRAGVPERVAMMIIGHKTRDIFERYNIVSDRDLQEAARRVEECIAARIVTLSDTLIATVEEKHL